MHAHDRYPLPDCRHPHTTAPLCPLLAPQQHSSTCHTPHLITTLSKARNLRINNSQPTGKLKKARSCPAKFQPRSISGSTKKVHSHLPHATRRLSRLMGCLASTRQEHKSSQNNGSPSRTNMIPTYHQLSFPIHWGQLRPTPRTPARAGVTPACATERRGMTGARPAGGAWNDGRLQRAPVEKSRPTAERRGTGAAGGAEVLPTGERQRLRSAAGEGRCPSPRRGRVLVGSAQLPCACAAHARFQSAIRNARSVAGGGAKDGWSEGRAPAGRPASPESSTARAGARTVGWRRAVGRGGWGSRALSERI